MSEAITVENVNVAQIMSVEGTHEVVDKMIAVMEENPVAKKLMDAAQTLEDMYAVTKEYVEMKLEDFKVIFNKTVDYFKESKTELPDEVMDTVVGGWSLGSFVNKWKRQILATCILLECVATGVLIGAAVGGPAGALVGAFGGLVVGCVSSGGYMDATSPKK